MAKNNDPENAIQQKLTYISDFLSIHHLTIATAESCTGGMLASLLTSMNGASRYFLGGIVCYSDESKHILLNISHVFLEKHTSISAAVTEALAKNIRFQLNSAVGVAITGLADPTSRHPLVKPGTCFIAVVYNDQLLLKEIYLNNLERNDVRRHACQEALDLVWQILNATPPK